MTLKLIIINMPTKYPKGSYITSGHARRKVLEELGDLRFLSSLEDDSALNWGTVPNGLATHIAELERGGWVESAQESEDEQKLEELEKYTRDFLDADEQLLVLKKVRELFLD